MRCAGVASTSWPSIAILPLTGRISPEITRISVVLPAPLGPITPTASPALTSRSMPNNAWKVP